MEKIFLLCLANSLCAHGREQSATPAARTKRTEVRNARSSTCASLSLNKAAFDGAGITAGFMLPLPKPNAAQLSWQMAPKKFVAEHLSKLLHLCCQSWHWDRPNFVKQDAFPRRLRALGSSRKW